jgi:hypothetical protein
VAVTATALSVLWIISLPTPAHTRQDASAGEELYMEVLGCWTCHGRVSSGAGGEGEPLHGTYLPLSLFIKELRLPSETMPPFSSILATDEELALVYAWLEGADPVVAPPSVAFTLEGFDDLGADTEAEVTLTATATAAAESGHEAAAWRYRITLFERDNALVADLPLQQQHSSKDGWSALATDSYGQAFLGPETGVSFSEMADGAGSTLRVRLALPPGRYVFVVEAVAASDVADPVIYGIGTAVIDTK